MKKLSFLLLLSSLNILAIPPSASQVAEELGAKNAISFNKYSIDEGNLPNLSCSKSAIESTSLCKSGGAYIVQTQDWKTNVYLYDCSKLVDCGKL